jgi:TRAP-type C4-dicarboxylate transport system permease small subunit
MKKSDTITKKIDATVISILKWICIVAFAVITVIVTLEVILGVLGKAGSSWKWGWLSAFVSTIDMNWKDEIVEMLFAALVFYGSAAIWVEKGHFSAGDWIGRRIKNPRGKAGLRLLLDIINLSFIVIFLVYSGKLVSIALEVTTKLLIPKKILYLCMPVSAALMAVYAVKFIILDLIQVIKPVAPEASAETETGA